MCQFRHRHEGRFPENRRRGGMLYKIFLLVFAYSVLIFKQYFYAKNISPTLSNFYQTLKFNILVQLNFFDFGLAFDKMNLRIVFFSTQITPKKVTTLFFLQIFY
ncbi:hypothetical protein GPALN_004990 [Globodera pallida]|nr:hypothetical protein GPALN_004990 [Globodera pallida]